MNFLFPYMARWKAINWTRFQRILSAIAEQGHTVHVIQMPKSHLRETNFQEIDVRLSPNIHLHDLGLNGFHWRHQYPFHKLIKKGLYSLACVATVRRMIREFHIDVLLVYNLSQYPILRATSCLKIFDYADDYIDMLKFELGFLQNPLLLSLGRKLLQGMAKRADLTFAVSHVLADSLDGISEVKVIANGVDLKNFTPDPDAIPHHFTKPVIGFLGSFEYFIDFDVILHAAQQLGQYTFLLVGAGRNYDDVERKIKKMGLANVVLTGGVPFHQVPSYIKRMDVCLNIFKDMPVSHGASPMKLFEYIALRKPVISTRLKEVHIIDRDFIYYADTGIELVARIEEILRNREKSAARAEVAYEYVRKNYTWDHIVRQFLAAINEKMSLA
ncbi:glycosyltransferase [candidate division KSB1 bacterium]|nr:glycosyltransferase [candidate division KSB1 bacterium]RQW03057.1 MAG: glycosyltransferase [candidate division KSB1 bacterium]